MATWIPESASPRAAAPGWTFGAGAAARTFAREPAALVGLAMVAAYAFVALSVSFLPLRDPLQVSSERLAAPTLTYPLGTDALGRDPSSRVLFAARLSIGVTFFSVGAPAAVEG